MVGRSRFEEVADKPVVLGVFWGSTFFFFFFKGEIELVRVLEALRYHKGF